MSKAVKDKLNERTIEQNRLSSRDYKYGFFTDIEMDTIPKGLSEDIINMICDIKKEPDWMRQWRLKAYRHWTKMKEPHWPNFTYGPIDYQDLSYYTAPKSKTNKAGLKSMDEVDPELVKTFEKLGIPISEQKRLSGVAVDAVFDSVSVGTTHQSELNKVGVIFCSMTEAVLHHPDLVKKYMGSVVPYTDNFFASLNSAVFSDGSF